MENGSKYSGYVRGGKNDALRWAWDDELEAYNVSLLGDLAKNSLMARINSANEWDMAVAVGAMFMATAQAMADEFIERNGNDMNTWTRDEHDEVVAMRKVMKPLSDMCESMGLHGLLEHNPVQDLLNEAESWMRSLYDGKMPSIHAAKRYRMLQIRMM